jgi:hypothetical protein
VVIAVKLINGTGIGNDVMDGVELDDAMYRYIEIIKGFKIYEIIADTKLIHAHYRIFWLDVKSECRDMRL